MRTIEQFNKFYIRVLRRQANARALEWLLYTANLHVSFQALHRL